MGETTIKVKMYSCERCSHEWQPRKEEKPIICPECKSPYWDRKREKDVRGE